MPNIPQLLGLIENHPDTAIAREFLGKQADNNNLVFLFSILLQNSRNRTLFHGSMIRELIKSPEFLNALNENSFDDLSALKAFLFAQIKEEAKLSLMPGEELDETEIEDKVNTLIQASNAQIKKLQVQSQEKKEIVSDSKSSFFSSVVDTSQVTVNFVWIKLAKSIFPSLSLDKSYVTDGRYPFEKLIPQENLRVLQDWVKVYGKNAINVWLDSRLLEKTEYDALVKGLQEIGVKTHDIGTAYPDDLELKKIPDIAKHFSQHQEGANVGYLVDLIKFKAMFHFANNHQQDKFIYVHSDFDYAPFSKKHFIDRAGFQTDWGSRKTIENDFFICDSAHQKKHPGLLDAMNQKHTEIIQKELFKKETTNALFLHAYHTILMDRYKQLNSAEKAQFKIDHTKLEKHAASKHQFRTWSP